MMLYEELCDERDVLLLLPDNNVSGWLQGNCTMVSKAPIVQQWNRECNEQVMSTACYASWHHRITLRLCQRCHISDNTRKSYRNTYFEVISSLGQLSHHRCTQTGNNILICGTYCVYLSWCQHLSYVASCVEEWQNEMDNEKWL